jgi:5-methylcytosine-specific restriction enzyme A
VSPFAPQHPCTYPGCSTLVAGRSSRCEKHQARERHAEENRRGSANSGGYGSRWRAARKHFLEMNPLCAECNRMGRLNAATIVDHIVPHKGDAALFWNQSNWQSLCRHCHNRKTAVSDGRWG